MSNPAVSPAKIPEVNTRTIIPNLMVDLLSDTVPLILGSPGIGKSAVVRFVADQINALLIDVRVTAMDPQDFNGLPFRNGDHADYLPFSELIPLEGQDLPDDKDGWVVFLDEFTSAERPMQAPLYKVILDRMIGNRKIHDKVRFVCAGNKATDKAIVNRMSSALKSRVTTYELVFNYKIFMEDVVTKYNWHPLAVAYLYANPDDAMDFDPNKIDMVATYSCPRTWDFVQRKLQNIPAGPIDYSYLPCLAGCITVEHANKLIAFSRVYDSLPKYEDIVAAPSLVPLPVDKGILFSMMAMLADRFEERHMDELIEFVERIPALETKAVFGRLLMNKNPQLLAHSKFFDLLERLNIIK